MSEECSCEYLGGWRSKRCDLCADGGGPDYPGTGDLLPDEIEGTRRVAVNNQRCIECGGANTTYQAMTGGRSYYCLDCEEVFDYPEGGARPPRVQMLADGRYDELREQMRGHLAELRET